LDPVTAQQAAREQLLLRHAERATDFRGMLEPAEVVHNTGLAGLLQVAESHGPMAGEGVLLVTSVGLVWAAERPSSRALLSAESEFVRERGNDSQGVDQGGLSRWAQGGGLRWPKTEIRDAEQRSCPRSWHRRGLGLPRRQRRQMRLLHMDVGGTEVELAKLDLLEREVLAMALSDGPEGGVNLAAVDRLLAIRDRRARMLGLDSPSRVEVTMRVEQVAKALIAVVDELGLDSERVRPLLGAKLRELGAIAER
jgi:hypothetical protein